jgi:hypothetical protein
MSVNQPPSASNPKSRFFLSLIGCRNLASEFGTLPRKRGSTHPKGQNYCLGGPSSLSISILFKPKSHASIEKAPGPMNDNPAPIHARRMAGQRVSWKTRISLTDRAIDKIPAAGVHNPAISTPPTANSSKPRVNGKTGSPYWTLTLPSIARAAPEAIRMSSNPRAGRPPTKFEMNRRTNNPKRCYPRMTPLQ